MFRAKHKKLHRMLLSAVVLIVCFVVQPTIGTNSGSGRRTGTTLLARNNRPDSPLAMAVLLEKLLAQGAGIMLPFPDMLVKQDGGIVPLDATQTVFPPEFLAGLIPETVDSVTVWRITLRVDDETGNVIFYNADNEPFWIIEADPAIYSPEWVARHRSPTLNATEFQTFFASRNLNLELTSRDATGLTFTEKRAVQRYQAAWSMAQQYLRPSHVELSFTFVMRYDVAAFRTAQRAACLVCEYTNKAVYSIQCTVFRLLCK